MFEHLRELAHQPNFVSPLQYTSVPESGRFRPRAMVLPLGRGSLLEPVLPRHDARDIATGSGKTPSDSIRRAKNDFHILKVN
jgi:hypothetical protein